MTCKNLLQLDNWTREQLQIIRNIQQGIREEIDGLAKEMWDQKIIKADNIYDNQAKFWRKVAMMMGSSTTEINYLLHNISEMFYPKEKKNVIMKYTQIYFKHQMLKTNYST